jgi:hypothetical protein
MVDKVQKTTSTNYSPTVLWRTRRNYRNLISGNKSPEDDLNQVPHECKADSV